ncbi:hypothetical protein FRC08_007933 [Ceratobasidium sp. 394]|nr:hypothetical protein FRC08_007933 [Ceratobasidium sp. 394]
MAPSSRVFAINEVLLLILTCLPVHEVARVLPVNHAFFELGVGIVWKDLNRVAHLFAVLDRPFTQPRGNYTPVAVSVPPAIPPDLMSRFKRYANCVRQVTNFRGPGRGIKWLGLEHLLQPASIVPNVRTVSWAWREYESDESVDWLIVLLLLGPSTSSLRCFGAGSRCGLTVEFATLLLARALDMRSSLAELTLYTKAPTSDAALTFLFSLLLRFNCLTALGLSASLVRDRLLDCIRRLPSLRTLSLIDRTEIEVFDPPRRWGGLDGDSDWEGEMFPSLESLAVRCATFDDLGDLFASYPSLLRPVTMLDLHISHDEIEGIQIDAVTRLFDLLSDSSPQLSHFTLAFPNSTDPYMVPISILDRLRAPNLERLTVHSVCLTTDSSWCAEIFSRWPRLSHLIVPHQPTLPSDLLELAEHGSLQVLCADLTGPPEDVNAMASNCIGGSAPATGVRLESQFELSDLPADKSRDFARFLLRCWPDVTLVWRNKVHEWPASIQPPNRNGYEMLMRVVDELRGGGNA